MDTRDSASRPTLAIEPLNHKNVTVAVSVDDGSCCSNTREQGKPQADSFIDDTVVQAGNVRIQDMCRRGIGSRQSPTAVEASREEKLLLHTAK